jgi:hypothetical protein
MINKLAVGISAAQTRQKDLEKWKNSIVKEAY